MYHIGKDWRSLSKTNKNVPIYDILIILGIPPLQKLDFVPKYYKWKKFCIPRQRNRPNVIRFCIDGAYPLNLSYMNRKYHKI